MNLSFALFRPRPFRPDRKTRTGNSYFFSARIAALIAFLLPVQAFAGDLTDEDRGRISHLVGLDLRDAETAIFEWPVVAIPETGSDFVAYCGWVNAKNAYGAYAGFVSFSVWLVVQEGQIMNIQIPSGPGSGGVPSQDALCVEQGFGRK